MTRIAGIVFDIDGTIIDSMPYHNRSWPVMLERHGFGDRQVELVRNSAGRTGVELMRELFGADLSDERAHALVDEKEEIYRAMFRPHFREVRGFADFARAARAHGLKLALGTAGDAKNIAFALDNLGMHGFFDAAVGAPDVARGKPEPDIFLEAARRMGIAPAECIVFEDAPLGIEAARRAGMLAVAVTTSEPAHRFDALAHVIHVAADFRDITPGIILRLAHAHPRNDRNPR